MTVQKCLSEARIAEEIARQVSLDVHRDRMWEIARRWHERAEELGRRAEVTSPCGTRPLVARTF
jgi:hypothetical protein